LEFGVKVVNGIEGTLHDDDGDSVIRQPHTGVHVNRDMGPCKGQIATSNTAESKHTRVSSPGIVYLITHISRTEFVQNSTETVTW
jgi:hypothetical protein